MIEEILVLKLDRLRKQQLATVVQHYTSKAC